MPERISIESVRDTLAVDITHKQVEQHNRFQVVEIDVVDSDKYGRKTYSRFFISISINNRGQAVCEVATNKCDRTVSKTVTATERRSMFG